MGSTSLPVPPPDEQALIVRYVRHLDHRVSRLIKAKRRLIELLNEQKQTIIHDALTRGLDSSAPMKPSGINWLGDIPITWELRRAKSLCSAIIDCKNRTPEFVHGGRFTVVRTTNVRDGEYIPNGSYPTDERNYRIWTHRGPPRVGDVFFTREAPAGEACLVPDLEGLCMGQRMMYFRPDPSLVDSRFLLYSIYSKIGRWYISNACNGSTVGHLRLGQVFAFPLLWCPMHEQKLLVEHIQQRFASLDLAIAKAHTETDLIREFRTRLVADVVTGQRDVRHLDLPESEHITSEDVEREDYEEAECVEGD